MSDSKEVPSDVDGASCPSRCSSATFVGVISGDCECFCWDEVPEPDCQLINPEPEWIRNDPELRELGVPGRVYPNDICSFLGCEQGKRYKFTITVESVE